MVRAKNSAIGTNIFATKSYIPVNLCMDLLVANEGQTEKEVEGRAHPVTTNQDHESTKSFN